MIWIPCITSYITWEPASNAPVHPSAAIFHASGPRFTKNSETIAWLPGGRNCMRSPIRSKRLVLPPIRLVANATAISSAGKNARKRLKAIACEITLQRGNTRTNIPYARRRNTAAELIAGDYTCRSQLVSEASETHRSGGGQQWQIKLHACFSMWITGSDSPFDNGIEMGFTAI